MYTVAAKEKPGIPLPACVASVWGAFLHEGLMSPAKHDQRAQEILDAWDQGCIELVIAVSLFLPEVWRQICAEWERNDADFPGVFEYEVVSPLGKYLGDYVLENGGKLPEHDVVNAKITELITAFFRVHEPVSTAA